MTEEEKIIIPDDAAHHLIRTPEGIKLIRLEDKQVVNEWIFNKVWTSKDDKVIPPWVDCRLGKLLIVQRNSSPPRQYTVWDLFTKEVITDQNIYDVFPRNERVRAWITKAGVAITAGPSYDHGTWWSYIPYTAKYLWCTSVQTFLGCWVTDMAVDKTGEVVAVYDYEDDNIYVYDLTKEKIKGHTRGRCAWRLAGVERAEGGVNLSLKGGWQHDYQGESVVFFAFSDD